MNSELLPKAATTAETSVTHTQVPGGWKNRTLEICGRTFQIVGPAEPDAFLETLAQLPVQEHDNHDVYWAQLWQAAPPTARRILQKQWPTGLPALEFGCGLGIAGLAALAAGMHVTFSDYVEFAVQTAVENARLNHFTEVHGEVLDWRDPPQKKWPFLFACDILYNQDMHASLVNFIDQVLTSDGLCWIGDAGRFHAAKFLQRAQARGFKTRIENEAGEVLLQPHHGKFQLFILER